MNRVRQLAMATVAAIAVVGCVPQPRLTASLPSPDSTPAADLCTHAERVIAERGALGEAYELVIRDDVPAAADTARQIRQRLDVVAQDLRDMRVSQTNEAVRVAIRDHALTLDEAAAVIAERGASTFDRDVILADGRAVLPVMDSVLKVDAPGDPIAAACPTVGFAPEPVSFPTEPTNQSLGLPDAVGELTLESNVGSPGSIERSILEAAGVDPNRVRQTTAHASDLDGLGPAFDVIDGADAPTAALAEAVRAVVLPESERVMPERVAAFQLYLYRHSDEPDITVHVAVRGDRMVVFHDASDDVVRAILEAMP